MRKQILFVQGAGESVHDAWDDKLVRSLERELGDGYEIAYPRMPDEADPRYDAWKRALRDAFDALEDGAIVVGHSVGGAMLIHVLAERMPKSRLGALILLAAPFIGDGGWPSEDMQPRTDFGERLPADLPVFLHHGTKDETVPFAHMALYARTMPRAVTRAVAGADHQLDNDLRGVARDIVSLHSRAQNA
ncbi:MAG: alpha/beta fold hydrolase [Rhodanobacteraceae bacterium]